MSEKHKVTKDPLTGAETTGHVWDDNLQEFNNPLPKWWLWAFYGTIIFSIVYWILYPSWPTGLVDKGFIPGTKTITFMSDSGEEVTEHWTTRARLAHIMQNDPNELKRQEMVKKVAALPFDDVAKSQDNSAFVLAYGKGTFGDYCAACHQTGGQGVIGHYPNLIDDAWLWGGDTKDIENTITNGRNGNMPSHSATLTQEEITQVANYVLSLSGEKVDEALSIPGKTVFNTKGCSGCHTPTGVGMKALGSANLTDKIWTQANVPGSAGLASKVKEIEHVVKNGIKRQMPAFGGRLTKDEIKLLVAYVKLLGTE